MFMFACYVVMALALLLAYVYPSLTLTVAVLLACGVVLMHLRVIHWKFTYNNLFKTHEDIRMLDLQRISRDPMARITYRDGEIVEIQNLENDFKISEDMKLYIKDKSKNKWVEHEAIDHIEFFLHELDPIVTVVGGSRLPPGSIIE